jgi:aspartyl-tRNA(Asn)/glutamyl-tRNA(Gln) amidotransferase subunit B
MTRPYEIIIGLEVHVQLLTESKLFCGCSTRFGAPPNTQTCPICTGMPGVLPVMNRKAFQLALKTACALGCEIARFTKWDRKNYYYPDLPKNYQISQYDLPFSRGGYLDIRSPEAEGGKRRIGIIRVHLEEDAGKSMHDERAGQADSRIDLNRAGTPLLEIVTRPDLRSPTEAKLFLQELKLLLNYLEVSDCNMQEGSLRVDANINIRVFTDHGPVPTPIVEVKNMNSFRAVERALTYEAERQFQEFLETGHRLGDVPKQTRGWDEDAEITRPQRTKEESSDYRYFPEPDLVPVVVTDAEIEAIRQSLGELPAQLRDRLEADYGITPYDSDVIVSQGRAFTSYFERLASLCGEGKLAANWLQQEVLRVLNERQISIEAFPISPECLGELLCMVRDRRLDHRRAREVFARMLSTGQSAAEAVAALGFVEVSEEEIEALCRRLVAENPKTVADVKAGKIKAVGGLVGQAKKINPHVDPAKVREYCLRLISQA